MDPADIPNYCGMPREAQVPGNLTPTALPSARRHFFFFKVRVSKRKGKEGGMRGNERTYFSPHTLSESHNLSVELNIPDLFVPSPMRGDGNRRLAEINKQLGSSGIPPSVPLTLGLSASVLATFNFFLNNVFEPFSENVKAFLHG